MREIWLLEMLSQPRAWRQVLGTAGGDALHVDLLHDGEQRARAAPARFEERAIADVAYEKLWAPRACLPLITLSETTHRSLTRT